MASGEVRLEDGRVLLDYLIGMGIVTVIYSSIYLIYVMYMSEYTTILIHKETKERLATLKDYGRESYEEIINKLITIYEKLKAEGQLSEKTKKDIQLAREQIQKGKGISTKELVAGLGL